MSIDKRRRTHLGVHCHPRIYQMTQQLLLFMDLVHHLLGLRQQALEIKLFLVDLDAVLA